LPVVLGAFSVPWLPVKGYPVARESSVFKLSQLSASSLGVFRDSDAVRACVLRKQLTALLAAGIITRPLPDTYRMTAVARSNEQRLRAALLWAGDESTAAGRSAGELYRLEWNRRTFLFDFAFEREKTILEVNGRRGHDDSSDYEHDNENWSVPGRHGYRIAFATWTKVMQNTDALLQEAPSPAPDD
jgi:hypothetical protein